MKIIKTLIVTTMAFCIVGFLSSAVFSEDIIPEMKECMRSHDSPEVYQRVLQKYCDLGIIRQAMGLLVIKEPYVMKTEKEGPVICYTVEGTTIGTSSEILSDVTQTYKVCWVNGRVISLEFFGAKDRRTEEVIPEMKECMRSHTSKEAYQSVLQKYCDFGIIRQALGLLVIKEPYVVKTEKDGSVICYTVEGTTIGTSSEIPSDVTQVYKVWWDKGKVIALKFLGPKDQIVK